MKNKYLKYIYILIICFVLWLVGVPLGFRLVVNPLLPKIKKDYNIEIVSPKLRTSLFPNIKFKADEIKLLNKDNTPALTLNRPKLSVKVLPLLIAKVRINSFECSNLYAGFELTDKLYLGEYEIVIPEKNIDTKINRIKINNLKVNLKDNNTNHSINGNNFYYKSNRAAFIARGHADLMSNNNNGKIDFNIHLPRNKNLAKTKFNTDISNIDVSQYTNLVSKLTKGEIVSMRGNFNIKSNKKYLNGSIQNVKVEYKDNSKSIIFPQNLNITSSHKIKENGFKIKSLNIVGTNISANAKGEINNIFSKTPYFNLIVNVPKSDIRIGALMLPPIVTPDIDITKLKKYPFYGNIAGDLKIVGKYPEPNIYGSIKVTEGVLIKPIPNAEKGAEINIEMLGKKLDLDVTVPAGAGEVVYVTGDITIYGESFANLKVRSSQSVDLNLAEHVLNPLHEIFRFMIGPVPIMDVEGVGNVDLKIVGTKKDPHIWGDFNFRNTSARFFDVHNLKLERADGNLNFNDQRAHFVNNTGVVNGQNTKIEGDCTLFGDLNFDVHADNQNLSDLFTILTTSPMLEDIKQIVPPLTDIKGKSDFYLNLKGKLFDIADLKINENVIPKGYIKLLGNSAKLNGIPINNLTGKINYDKMNCDFDLQGNLSSGVLSKLSGSIKDGIADVKIDAPKVYVNDLDKTLKYLDPLFIKLNAKYRGPVNDIEIGGIDAVIDVIKDYKPVKNTKILSGKIILKNSNLDVSNLKGKIRENPFNIDLNARSLGAKKLDIKNAKINGSMNCKEFDLTTINSIANANIMPADIQKELNKVNFKSGTADIWGKIRNNKTDAVSNIHRAELEYFIYKNKKGEKVYIPISVISGQVSVKNETLKLNKLNTVVDTMPVMVYGDVNNIYKNPQYNIHVNSKLIQKFFDKYWNAHNIYPIKVSGDIICNSTLIGNKNHTRVKSNLKMEEKSNIYYMGATIGDNVNPIYVDLDADTDKTGWIKINKFKYNKVISSQNNKQNLLPMLSVNGQIKSVGKFFEMKNLIVKTENPSNANIFNIIFKKPTIKQGTFTSDVKINGRSDRPKIIGKFGAKNLEMPYINTAVKSVNVEFKPDIIDVITKGTVLDNYIMVNANIKNHLVPPYKVNSADIYINDFDVDRSFNQFKQVELKGLSSVISADTDAAGAQLMNSVHFNNVKVRAGTVRIRNIKASDLEAVCSLNDKMQISVNPFKFNMASGTISGKLDYNLLNNFSKTELSAKGVNANELIIALFDLPNQMYGQLTGNIELSCNATDDKTRLSTLSGYGTFNVSNGRMPKLGSLEYLLRAGNLIKGGITGLSMNGIIDVVTPMKTGEFESINGRIRIKDGVAKTIEINSKGKNLSLYIIGSLNLVNQIADMHVYGQLSRKVSTILGAVGNISLNTLFNKIPGVSLDGNSQFINDLNKIPGIELSNKSIRRFMVEIMGDVNGDDAVKSFKWIN